MMVSEICLWNSDKLVWRHENLHNLFHQEGEEFMLRAAFTGGVNSTIIPTNYYLGLDNRSTIAADDIMDDLVSEPTGSGYTRQTVSSSGDFSLNLEDGHYVATSPIVAFRATTGTWGPVSNLFFTNKDDSTGYLISTVVLPSVITLTAGNSVTMRIGMKLICS